MQIRIAEGFKTKLFLLNKQKMSYLILLKYIYIPCRYSNLHLFFRYSKCFLKNSICQQLAIQNISFIFSQVKMTKRDILSVISKTNSIYRLFTIFQCLLLFPRFHILIVIVCEENSISNYQ